MRSLGSHVNIILLTLLLALADGHPAHAYIDPGTGSYMLQILIASLLGGAFLIKIYWKKLIAFFSRKSSDREDAQ